MLQTHQILVRWTCTASPEVHCALVQLKSLCLLGDLFFHNPFLSVSISSHRSSLAKPTHLASLAEHLSIPPAEMPRRKEPRKRVGLPTLRTSKSPSRSATRPNRRLATTDGPVCMDSANPIGSVVLSLQEAAVE